MEGRKLQLAGGSTYVVSLPKRWVTSAGLKAGDTLFLEAEPDGSVSVRYRSVEKPAARRKVFHEKGEEAREHLLRKFIGAYVSGFDLIEVRYSAERGPFVRRVAREFCRLVIGPEVIEEQRNALVIQDLSDTSELSAEKCLRRMHLIVRAMLDDAVLAFKTSAPTLAHDVALRDQDVDRLYWMVAKQHTIKNGRPPDGSSTAPGLHNHRLVAKLLERIGDHAQRIAETYPTVIGGKGLDARLIREIEEAKVSAVAILDKAFNSLLTGNIDLANEAIDARAAHQKLIDALSHRVATRKGEELLALGAVVDSLGRTASYAADIAEQAINWAVLTEPAAS
ncbi:MAG: AbrB/MazE/SpoVT family DNA-binding domain-containing protein [Thermoplasmata archaeon]|nr:AbrB/MazE/SpoVT family DNA-binding domain-containing protein [Thermoplasmata archaeon]